jgi:hypothetical protein
MSFYNAVQDSLSNMIFGIHFGGRAKIWDNKSIIVEYDQPLNSHDDEDYIKTQYWGGIRNRHGHPCLSDIRFPVS